MLDGSADCPRFIQHSSMLNEMVGTLPQTTAPHLSNTSNILDEMLDTFAPSLRSWHKNKSDFADLFDLAAIFYEKQYACHVRKLNSVF